MDVDRYLARIHYSGGREPNAANLGALVLAHRLSVPYETLDLWRRRHASLATEAVYDKIVRRNRGGYCFELNGLFAALLRALGYQVREYFGRWLIGEDMEVPMRRHRVVCVALPTGPNRIVDVGIGLPFMLSPLEFVFNEPQRLNGKWYRIVRDPVLTCVVEVRRSDGVWTRLFSFDTAPQLPIDFAYAHWWCETHPESSFVHKVWVYRPQTDGGACSVSLEPDPETGELTFVLAHISPDGAVRRVFLHGETELASALKEHFGIVETAREGLDFKTTEKGKSKST